MTYDNMDGEYPRGKDHYESPINLLNHPEYIMVQSPCLYKQIHESASGQFEVRTFCTGL